MYGLMDGWMDGWMDVTHLISALNPTTPNIFSLYNEMFSIYLRFMFLRKEEMVSY